MKAVILAGGLGTRLSEETALKPKPLVEVGGYPILWHIMKMYQNHGINEFVVCAGYKGYLIKEFFVHYHRHVQDVCVDMVTDDVTFFGGYKEKENWKVTIIDTGENTMTGGRVNRIKEYVKDDEMFCLTYGDGVSNIDISASIDFHKKHGKIATIGAVYPPGRFGALDLDGSSVKQFVEKPLGDNTFINGGFFVLSPKVFDYLGDDTCVFEQEPLNNLAKDHQLEAFKHTGFWQCMDTLRDKHYLEDLWASGKAPWIKK